MRNIGMVEGTIAYVRAIGRVHVRSREKRRQKQRRLRVNAPTPTTSALLCV